MIVLVGFMGAGKTTIGRLLAERLGIPFVDVDAVIERREQRLIREIFEQSGEEEFRRIEHDAVVESLNGPDAVVALGGGAVENPGTLRALDSVFVVFLEVEFDEAMLRIGRDQYRPMISNPDIKEIYVRRLPLYRSVSNLTIRTAERSAELIVSEIVSCVAAGGQ